MRVAVLGGGTIARLMLEHRAELPGIEFVALAGRSAASRGKALAAQFGVAYVVGREALLAQRPNAGVGVIVLSAGALADDALRQAAERAAERSGALFYVPSGGIGGLDALRTACLAGVDEVSIQVAKPPAAWRGIAFVERLGIDLQKL